MASSTYDGTVNFHSYIENGVDPRTGTFSANLLLGTLVAPDFDVRLCYSPLNQKNFGFGHGWRIPVTIYNTKSKLLSLSDGRMYEVEEDGSTLTVKGNMGDIHAVKLTQPEGIKVIYRDTGIVERLHKKSNWYACAARTSPSGDALYFKWHVDEDEATPKIMLREIFKSTTAFDTVDDEGIEKTILLDISMKTPDLSADDDPDISIAFLPQKNKQGKLLNAWRHFSLTLSNNQLTQVSNRSFWPALEWKFGYDESLSPCRLSMITSPLGKVDSITHSKQKFLLQHEHDRVAQHDTHTTNAPSEQGATESLSRTDFYSYHLLPGKLTCMKKSGQLGFENHKASNRVECTASIYETKHFLEIAKIELIETVQNIGDLDLYLRGLRKDPPETLKWTNTVYSKAKYALPDHEITYIMNTGATADSLTLRKVYTWDEYGRLIKKNNDHEAMDEYSYLDKDGTESALLERHVHTSNHSTITNKYSYSKFDATACPLKSIPGQQSNLLQSLIRETTMGSATTEGPYIETCTSEYFDTPGEFCHGKLKQQQTFLLVSGTAVEDAVPTQTTTYRYDLEGEEQTTKATITGFDGSVATVESVKSIYTGLTLEEKDIDGNVSDYSWDPLSRLTKIINNSTTSYRTEENFTHGIIDWLNTYAEVFGEEQPLACFKGYIIQQDSTGRKILTGHDAYNHEVQTWIFLESLGNYKWVLAEEKRYDSARRIINHTLIETDDQATRRTEYHTVYLTPYSYWTYHERAPEKYDITHTLISESDKIRVTTYIDSEVLKIPDGYAAITKTLANPGDPKNVGSTAFHKGGVNKTYAIPDLNFKSGKNRCWSYVERVDSRGNLIEKHIYTMDVEADEGKDFSAMLTPTLHSSKKYRYNEQNTVISFEDEYRNLTTFKRDVFNRPSVITRPDASTLEYAYATHSDKSLITKLSVSSAGITTSLGAQVFDGLERLKESDSGGRKQAFEYSEGLQTPTKILKPDGKHLQYDVISELGGAIKSIKAESLEHNFEYFPDSGLLQGYSDQSGYKSALAYDSQRNVIREEIIQVTGRPSRTLSNHFRPPVNAQPSPTLRPSSKP